MQKNISKKFTADSEAFSIGALVLARLRRTSGRVIDVMYMVENKDYAQYVIDLSLLVEDAELSRLVLRLQNLIDVEQANQPVESIRSMHASEAYENDDVSGATEEEIYKAQVSHHYIGALR